MLTYSQSTGELSDSGVTLGIGWAGCGDGKNNHDMQFVRMVGPLPVGKYRIKPPLSHKRLGPLAYELVPYQSNDMRGRDDFWIHGPSKNPEKYGQESNGCIIMSRDIREKIRVYTGCDLEVIP